MSKTSTSSTHFIKMLGRKTILTYVLIPIVLFTHFFAFYYYYHKLIPIRYWDEHAWIGRSYYFDLYLKGDINNPAWYNYYSYDQPKLGEYLYGLTLYLKYLKYCRDNKCNYTTFLIDHNFLQVGEQKYLLYAKTSPIFINWGGTNFQDFDISEKDLLTKYGDGFKKTIKIIYQARKTNILLLSFNIITTYIILNYLYKTKKAIIITFLYGLNPLIINAGLRAQSDALFVFLFNLSLLIIIYYFVKRSTLLYLTLISIATALLAQTKLNGVMLFLFVELLILIQILITIMTKRGQLMRLITHFSLSAVIFSTVFILIDPYLFKNPIKNTIFMFEFRQEMTKKHIYELNLQYQYLPNFYTRIATIYRNFFYKQSVLFFNTPITLKPITVNKHKPEISIITILVSLIGAIDMLVTSLRNRNKQGLLFIIVFIFVQIMIGIYLIVDWDRYYMHLVLFFSCFYGIGLYNLFRFSHNFIDKVFAHNTVIVKN